MVDYRFLYEPPRRPGRAVFSLTNAGKVNHRLTIIPIGDDVPPIDEQLHGSTRRGVDPEAQSSVLRPGEAETIAIDVLPGQRYAFVCFLVDPGDTIVNGLKGMNSEFRVGKRNPG